MWTPRSWPAARKSGDGGRKALRHFGRRSRPKCSRPCRLRALAHLRRRRRRPRSSSRAAKGCLHSRRGRLRPSGQVNKVRPVRPLTRGRRRTRGPLAGGRQAGKGPPGRQACSKAADSLLRWRWRQLQGRRLAARPLRPRARVAIQAGAAACSLAAGHLRPARAPEITLQVLRRGRRGRREPDRRVHRVAHHREAAGAEAAFRAAAARHHLGVVAEGVSEVGRADLTRTQ